MKFQEGLGVGFLRSVLQGVTKRVSCLTLVARLASIDWTAPSREAERNFDEPACREEVDSFTASPILLDHLFSVDTSCGRALTISSIERSKEDARFGKS